MFVLQQLALKLSGLCQDCVPNLFFTGLRAKCLLLKRNRAWIISYLNNFWNQEFKNKLNIIKNTHICSTGSAAEVVREASLPLSAIYLCFAVMDYVYSKFILVVNPVRSVFQRLKSLHLQSAERVAYQKDSRKCHTRNNHLLSWIFKASVTVTCYTL